MLFEEQKRPVPILPPEIWEQIALYLPTAELHQVKRLQSTFWKLALDDTYHELALYQLYDNDDDSNWLLCKKMERLLHLRQPHICQRIRSLRLDPRATLRYRKKADNARTSLLESVSTAVHGIFLRRSQRGLPATAHQLVTQLVELKSLHIIKPYQPQDRFLDLAAFAWKYHFVNPGPGQTSVRNLHLDLYPGQGLQRILQIPQPGGKLNEYRSALMRLGYLRFRVIELYQGGENERNGLEEIALFSNLLKLFNPAHQTGSKPTSDRTTTSVSKLTKLHFRICCTPRRQYPPSSAVVQPIFGALNPSLGSPPQPTFPNLTHCAIIIIDAPAFPQVMQFLSHHRRTITHLRTSPHRFHDFRSMDSAVPPPAIHSSIQIQDQPPSLLKLRHLELASTGTSDELFWANDIQTLRAYLISAYSPSDATGVTRVIIDLNIVCSYHNLCALLKPDDFQPWPPTITTLRLWNQLYPSCPDWLPRFQASLTLIRHLSLTSFTLTPGYLDLLLSSIPNLSSLHMRLQARVWESPFRASYRTQYEITGEYYSSPRLGVNYPIEEDRKKAILKGFLDELKNRAAAQSDSNVSGNGRVSRGEGVNIRIGLGESDVKMEVDVRETVRKALREAYPEVVQLVIGSDLELDNGVFEDKEW